MMQRFLGPIGLTVIACIAVWVQMGWVQVWPAGNTLVNIGLLVVIGVTLFRSWYGAVGIAVLIGVLWSQYSVWPTYVYPIAFVGVVIIVRLLTQRFMAARSTASLIFSVAIATMMFYALIVGLVVGQQIFEPAVIGIVWSDFIFMAVTQSLIHPIIMYVGWRRFTGGSFSTPAEVQKISRPF